MTTFLLVPGAWHGGWVWREVADLLTTAGHRPLCLTLTGLADRRHLLSDAVDLDTHIDDIVEAALFAETDDLVLVAHSYGGVPATGAADRIAERFRALVFLDATIAENGRSAIDLRNAQTPTHPVEVTAGVPIPPLPAEVFGLEGVQARRVDRLLTAQPWATYTQPISLTGEFESIERKHYVRAFRYEAAYFDASYERAAADPSWTTERRDIGHDMMLIDPHWTAQVILATSC
jgi:pimeloyl-ACP methyl ester carboxylesterase